LDKPFDVLYDFFYLLFNPKYFTFQSTGFAGAGGRLGGPITLNNRAVMEVQSTERVYLSGLTKNHYNGSMWTDTIRERDLYTDGFSAGHFEMLETAHALIKHTGFHGTQRIINAAYIRERFPEENISYLHPHDFPAIDISIEFMTTDFNSLVAFYDFIDSLDMEMMVFLGDVDPVTGRQFGIAMREGLYRAYLPLEKVTISVDNRTGTIFRPAKSRDMLFHSEYDYASELFITPSGDKYVMSLLERGTSYESEYLHVDTRIDFVREILNASHRGAYGSRSAVSPQNFGTAEFDALHRAFTNEENTDTSNFNEVLHDFSHGVLSRYAESVYRNYLSLPDTLPQRVYDLAFDITRYAERNYEKVLAIEAYLLEIPYTLNPPPVPNGVDFVDFFLFEAKEGYCTYFASAMAVLSRAVGIPSRFTEGYLLPPRNERDHFIVTNANAHAWAEVYLEGYGWLAMESTAPFRHAGDRRPAVSGGSGGSMFAESFAGFRSYEEYLLSIGIDIHANTPSFFWPEEVLIGMETVENRSGFVFNVLYIPGVFIVLVLLVIIFIWLCLISEKIRMWRIGHMSTNRQAQIYFKGVIKMTDYYNYPMDKNETPQTYGLRLGKRFAFHSDTKIVRDLVDLYYKARYGIRPITEKELDLMKEAYFDMRRLLKEVRIKPRFMYIRYFRGVFRI
jgi:hypothetical protein